MSIEIARANSAATLGILGGFDRADLSGLVLGVSKNLVEQTLLLGEKDFQFGLKLSRGEGLFEVSVFSGDRQVLWLSAWPKIELEGALKSIDDSIRQRNCAPFVEYLKNHPDAENFTVAENPHINTRAQFRELEFCHQYINRRVGPKEEFKKNVASLPFISTDELLEGAVLETHHRVQDEVVKVRDILGTSHSDTNWLLNDDRGDAYIYDMARAITQGLRLTADSNELALTKFEDFYFVSTNGRHRVAAVKGLMFPELTVRARVTELKPPFGLVSSTRARFEEIEKRIRAGLIEATVTTTPRKTSFSDFFVVHTVTGYANPLAFAQNLRTTEETARKAVGKE